MSRKEFIRILGGAATVAATAPNYGFSAPNLSTDGVLIEASGFSDKGGWSLDTQFYQQMGGCYLLAHGMGKPVANAKTTVEIPKDGSWHVFVRTKDWCPGDWKAPGRFKVKLNDTVLGTEFGTEAGWAWQQGGTIDLKAGKATVELQDLTGFGGRVDAIYLSPSKDPKLPTSVKDLVGWKDELTGRSKLTVKETEYELVVVGGGISGCAAALAAKKEGMKVALVQDRPVFGGNASDEIRVHTEGIHGKSKAILKKLDTVWWPNGDGKAAKDQVKREKTMKDSGVVLMPNNMAIGLAKEGNRIVSVEARDTRTGIIKRLKAPVFIDCTGDAWLGFWSGAEFRYGREAHSEFGEKWAKKGELWSPEKADNRVMGSSVLWNSQKSNTPSTFPDVPWAMPVVGDASATKGEWFWEYGDNTLHQIEDAEEIRDHVWRAIYGNFANAKKEAKYAKVELKWVAYVAGRRESRRIIGDHVFVMDDVMKQRKFPDTVVEETRKIDCHFQRKETGHKADYLSEALFLGPGGDKKYYLPFRSMYSKDIANLMMAGRCFSCSHVGLGGPRVMNTCGQMGVATGYAAALCVQHKTDPRGVYKKHIKALRKMIGYS